MTEDATSPGTDWDGLESRLVRLIERMFWGSQLRIYSASAGVTVLVTAFLGGAVVELKEPGFVPDGLLAVAGWRSPEAGMSHWSRDCGDPATTARHVVLVLQACGATTPDGLQLGFHRPEATNSGQIAPVHCLPGLDRR